jgi:hypothetical protein
MAQRSLSTDSRAAGARQGTVCSARARQPAASPLGRPCRCWHLLAGRSCWSRRAQTGVEPWNALPPDVSPAAPGPARSLSPPSPSRRRMAARPPRGRWSSPPGPPGAKTRSPRAREDRYERPHRPPQRQIQAVPVGAARTSRTRER